VQAALSIKEQSILEGANRQAETIAREARVQANEEAIKLREQTEKSFGERRARISEAEKRMVERESLINRQLEHLVDQEKALRTQQEDYQQRSKGLEQQRAEISQLVEQRRKELESVANLSENDARSLLLKEVEMEALQDASAITRRILDEAKTRAEEKARRIISVAIQRYAGGHTFETTSATLALPDEELKVYGAEYGRTGFQGGLQWYRCRTTGRYEAELEVFAGRTIDVPSCFIAGRSDWGIYQKPGDIERMQDTVCTQMLGCHLVDGAGHWVQQEQPREVSKLLIEFLRQVER